MPILKSSPGELAIHGGGPPAFESRLPVHSARAGNTQRFAELAERMFLDATAPGSIVEEFECEIAKWLGVRNAVGFASTFACVRAFNAVLREGYIFAPTFGFAPSGDATAYIDLEPSSWGLDPNQIANALSGDVAAVFATHLLGRPCDVDAIDAACQEWDTPLIFFGHQSLGCTYRGTRIGGRGWAELFPLGRDQLVHASDATIVSTDDDLLAHRLRSARGQKHDGMHQAMSDAAAAMGLANLEATSTFIAENRIVFDAYRYALDGVPGITLVGPCEGSTFQSISVLVDPAQAGLTRDSLYQVLASENIASGKPFRANATTPLANLLEGSLLQLPSGAMTTPETIEAVCRIVELAIVRNLEAPDPLRLAA